MSATCPNCGKSVRTGAKFCSHCGKEMPATIPLSQEAALPPENVLDPVPEAAAPEAASTGPQPAETHSSAPASEICLHCGKTIRQGIKFCNFCGNPTGSAGQTLGTSSQSDMSPAVPPPPAILPPVQPPSAAEPPRKKGKKKGWLVVLILLLVILCALAAVAFLALRGTFGDLQLPDPLEELSSRLQPATPTSEPTRTPKPTKTPTATETPEPTFTPTLTLTPTMTPTSEPEYTFYDSFETGLNDWWSVFGPNLPKDANDGKLVLFSSPSDGSGINSVMLPPLSPGMEIGVLASIYDVPPNDAFVIRWTLDSLVSPAEGLNIPAAIQVLISTTRQELTIYDTTNNIEIATCNIAKNIYDGYYNYVIGIEENRISLYMEGKELCSVGIIPPDLNADGSLSFVGNVILDEVFILEK